MELIQSQGVSLESLVRGIMGIIFLLLISYVFSTNRKAINCISLTSNTSILTAWGNDKDFDDCFARQISAFNGNKVICIGISTSGKSKNIVKGLKEAKKNGFKTIALIGSSSEIIKKYSDIIISIKAKDTDRIQEAHLFTYHFLCQEIEKQI